MPSVHIPTRPPAWQIVVAGGGIPSLAFALATARGAGEAVRVSLLDPRAGAGGTDRRAYAISPAAAAMLETLGIWPGLRGRAQPVAGMRITDGRAADAVRQSYLAFGGRDDAAPLAYIVAAPDLHGALWKACEAAGIVFHPVGVDGFDAGSAEVSVRPAHGQPAHGQPAHGQPAIGAALLVAADGARSRLREDAGIGWVGGDYPQSGLVATVSHEQPHGGRAIQHFLPGGPFAILPLAGAGRHHPHRSSIVWTETTARARALAGLAPDAMAEVLARMFGPGFGAVALDTPVAAHPLQVGLARRFVGARLALLGDAAHAVHPLAGQGLNLGLGDAAALAEQVVDRVRLGLDPGAPDVLTAYERERRPHAVALAGVTDGLNRLFSNDVLPLRALRDVGLGLVEGAPGVKRLFSEAAAGRGPGAPRLMRGEAL